MTLSIGDVINTKGIAIVNDVTVTLDGQATVVSAHTDSNGRQIATAIMHETDRRVPLGIAINIGNLWQIIGANVLPPFIEMITETLITWDEWSRAAQTVWDNPACCEVVGVKP